MPSSSLVALRLSADAPLWAASMNAPQPDSVMTTMWLTGTTPAASCEVTPLTPPDA